MDKPVIIRASIIQEGERRGWTVDDETWCSSITKALAVAKRRYPSAIAAQLIGTDGSYGPKFDLA